MLFATNVVIACILVSTALIYGYGRYRFDSIKTGSSAGLSSAAGSGGLQPENILLIGNETRAGQTMVNFGNPDQLTGTLSDVIMIVHLNPKTDSASLLSLPRDVFVPMPAGSEVGANQKIDAALNDGKLGPNNLAEAITQDFGIPINHYVEVDFDGFLQTVDALGGIKMDFPERLHDTYSGLNISVTGCQLIDGQQALALVRSRHLQYDPPGVDPNDVSAWPYDPESDLARIVRDHTFVRILASTAKSQGLTNPLKANAFFSAVLSQLTIDPGLKGQLLSLVAHYHGLNPNSAPASTIPVTQNVGADGQGYIYDGSNVGDVEFAQQPADTQTIESWDPDALPTPVRPQTVEVYNDTDSAHLATDTGRALSADGLHVTAETKGTIPSSQSETYVQYHPGQLAVALAVFEKLSGAVVLQSTARVPLNTVDVQAGTTLAVDAPPAPSGTAATTASAPQSTARPAAPTGSQTPSSAADQVTPYDPRPC